jgi:hypothetical protein
MGTSDKTEEQLERADTAFAQWSLEQPAYFSGHEYAVVHSYFISGYLDEPADFSPVPADLDKLAQIAYRVGREVAQQPGAGLEARETWEEIDSKSRPPADSDELRF